MRDILYIIILCTVLSFVSVSSLLTPCVLAAASTNVTNPHIIMNAPRTSPYADHPDLWKGRTIIQVPPQATQQSEGASSENSVPLEQTELTQSENWYPHGEPQAGKGVLWQEGTSIEDINRVDVHRIDTPAHEKQNAQNTQSPQGLPLNRGAAPPSASPSPEANSQQALNEAFESALGVPLNMRPFIERQLQHLSAYHNDNIQQSADEQLLPSALTGRSVDLDSTWRVSVTEPVKIDEDVLTSKRNVVGAYANMQGSGMQVFVGPELHIPESSPLQATPRDMDDTELGLGMQVLWDF